MHVKAKGMQVRLHLRYVGGMLETSVDVRCKMAVRKPKVMWLSLNLMPVRIGCRSGDACAHRFTYCRREAW